MRNQKNRGKVAIAQMICGGLLWCISAILTCSLFVSLAGDSWIWKTIMATLAIGLEGAKILTWRMGGVKRLFAGVLIGLSIFASFGAALQSVESYKSRSDSLQIASIRQDKAYDSYASEVALLDAQITTVNARLADLPPNYPTAAKSLMANLSELHNKRGLVIQKQAELSNRPSGAKEQGDMFALIGQAIGSSADKLMLVILMILAVSIEIGAIILVGEKGPGNGPTPSNRILSPNSPSESVLRYPIEHPMAPIQFLDAMIRGSSDLPLLAGRDQTAKQLGIPCYDAKKLVAILVEKQIIKARGKRYQLIAEVPYSVSGGGIGDSIIAPVYENYDGVFRPAQSGTQFARV